MQDSNIWSSSGVSAGVDAVIEWIAVVYGDGTGQTIANGMEYVRHAVATDDPFAGLYGSTHPGTAKRALPRQIRWA